MKALKKIVIILLVLAGLVVVAGLFLPKEVYVERSRTIDAPVEMAYGQIVSLKNWKNWSPWYSMDTNVVMTFENYGIGKGAIYYWESQEQSVGKGSLVIRDCKEFEYVNTDLAFEGQGNATAEFKFAVEEGKTVVTWTMHSDMGDGIMMGWLALAMKKMIQSSYDKGLADLDAYCQELKETEWHYVGLAPQDDIEFFGIPSKGVTMETMPQVMGESFGTLLGTLGEMQLEPAGYPFAVYYSWGEEFDMDCGVQLNNAPEEIGGLVKKRIEGAVFASYKHVGSYEGLHTAHTYLMGWLKQNNLEIAGPVFEFYETDPQKEPNPEKWVTEIKYPVHEIE